MVLLPCRKMSFSTNVVACLTKCLDEQLDGLVKHLSVQLGVPASDVAKALASYGLGKGEKNKITAKSIKKTKDDDSAQPTCEYVARGKENPCGKKASQKIEGKYYCGNYKEDGTATSHLKSVIANASKTKEPRKKPPVCPVDLPKKKILPKKVKGTLKNNLESSKEKTERLLKQVISEEYAALEIQRVGDRLMDKNTRILFDSRNHAYGKLGDDRETILPLDETDKTFLERHGIEEGPIPKGEDISSDDDGLELED